VFAIRLRQLHRYVQTQVTPLAGWATQLMRSAVAVAVAALLIGACGGSSHATTAKPTATDDAKCQASFKSYHDALLASDNNLTDAQESTFQAATVNSCNRAQWLKDVQPYNGSVVGDNPGNVIMGGTGAPDISNKVLKSFCGGNESAPACQ
jgi:hypothetical protein